MAKIIYEGKKIDVEDNSQITEACEKLGVPFLCYTGICKSCVINILKGEENLNEITEIEKEHDLEKSMRLACQCRIKSGSVIIDF
ncbi:2Fe-2S iron-sulfur cluster binding domain-containing protein [Candidatus Woesearchaeota archaeon]|nr:2Fe-2S iron-sulfur cluster binding domain-containing protein [Candidatus Woesearchaeota archaeon]